MGVQPIESTVSGLRRCSWSKFPFKINCSTPRVSKKHASFLEKFLSSHGILCYYTTTDQTLFYTIVSSGIAGVRGKGKEDEKGIREVWWLNRVLGDRPLCTGANFHFASFFPPPLPIFSGRLCVGFLSRRSLTLPREIAKKKLRGETKYKRCAK